MIAISSAQARTRYSVMAMIFHWVIAGFIVANLYIGWRLGFQHGMAQFTSFQLHKSIGITVLVLSIGRLAWRLVHKAPALPLGMSRFERAAARSTHIFFYVMMIGMPLTGWAVVSVSPLNIPTLLWHHIPWPHIGFLHALPTTEKKSVDQLAGGVHMALAYGGITLIVLHIAAALKHQFISRDGVLGRMVPFLSATSR